MSTPQTLPERLRQQLTNGTTPTPWHAHCATGPSSKSARNDVGHGTVDGIHTLCGHRVAGGDKRTPFQSFAPFACKRCAKVNESAKLAPSVCPLPHPSEVVALMHEAAERIEALTAIVSRALAIEESVTQGQERELRAGYVESLRAVLGAK